MTSLNVNPNKIMDAENNDTPRTTDWINSIGKSGVDWHHSATLMAEMSNNIEHDYIALIAELDACLKLEPRAVRCCEGGGAENIAASVAITMASVRKELDELRRQNEILRSKDNRWRKSNQSLINHNESLKDAIQALKDIIDGNRNDPENIAEIINGAIKLTAQPEPKPCPRCGQVPDMPFHTCMEQSEEKTK